MSGFADLSDEDDVYAKIRRDRPEDIDVDYSHYVLQVVIEASPMSLARIFGLLSTLSIVPGSTESSTRGDGTISLKINLDEVDTHKIDSLTRKIAQLTETLAILGKF